MSLFSRKINVDVDKLDEDRYEIQGELLDDFHHFKARMVISYPDFEIISSTGEMMKAPYQGYCQGSLPAMEKLVGTQIKRGFRRRAAELVGGPEGCSHLYEIVMNMAEAAFQVRYYIIRDHPELYPEFSRVRDKTGERRNLILKVMPALQNSCYIFNRNNDGLFEERRAGDN